MRSTGYHPSPITSDHEDFCPWSCPHKSLIAVALASCFAFSNVSFAADPSAETVDHCSLNAEELDPVNYKLNVLTHEDGNIHNYDSVSITHIVPTVQNQYTVSIKNGSVLNVEGKFSIELTAPEIEAETIPPITPFTCTGNQLPNQQKILLSI